MTRKVPGTYGFDAPLVPIIIGSIGIVFLAGGLVLVALTGLGWSLVVAAIGVYQLASAAIYVYATRRGKFAAWEDILDRLRLRGDERVLDLGCGRGMVLIQAARRLTTGTAVGVDLWRSVDQSGNAEDVTRANARTAGVSDRVELHTCDMTELPFADDSFDVVASSLAIHNIPSAEGRKKAVMEAARVLKPGGRLALADFRHTRDYAEVIDGLGWPRSEVRGLGWRFWYGGPWTGTSLVSVTKPADERTGAPLTNR